ncbi:phosphoribosylaminoimidazolesuccinocarboxamide synthase [Ignavibacteria bacterium]|nr:phosphoribosylaminoimidazolesuccinocarboxamide synthase [Bacteroidota bacterium]MCZ2133284.1 phosphoribosylaminoimidazolesuccinocarboxamide synthase [Bacteroidota bacterium]
MKTTDSAVYSTDFPALKLFRRGKVRDVYDLGDTLLMVATDRISAFDVIMSEPVPGKGKLLTDMSVFWFKLTEHIVRNHLISADIDDFPGECAPYRHILAGRSMLVEKTKPLPIECVARGYLAGSGWKEYQQNQTVCGIKLPDGLIQSSHLPNPVFTPATKAEEGHDLNISFEEAALLCSPDLAGEARRITLELYRFAADFAEQRNIILADTKFEFGLDSNGSLILIDEALTPDSSRYWLKEYYVAGEEQINFDKQVLRDYLETTDWNKQPPPQPLPASVIASVREKYQDCYDRLIGKI